MKLSEAITKLINQNTSKIDQIHALTTLSYFTEAKNITTNEHSQSMAAQFAKHSKQVKYGKGTILYRPQDKPMNSFILLSGSIKLFSSKTQQQIKSFEQKKYSTDNQQIIQLERLTGFSRQQLTVDMFQQFFNQKGFLKYHSFHIVNQGQYFGFAQMLEMSRRPFLAVALTKSKLLAISREIFGFHFKQYEIMKQKYIVEQLIWNIEKQEKERAAKLFRYLHPFTIFKRCYFEQILHEEEQYVTQVYMLLKGQLQITKTFHLELPKQILEKDLRYRQIKKMEIKLAVIVSKQIVGEEDLVLNRKNRTYTTRCTTENTFVLKIESGVFLRLLNEKYQALKGISKRAKLKMRTNQSQFEEIRNKLNQAFAKQFKNFEDRTIDKMIEDIIGDQKLTKQQIKTIHKGHSKNFRDTFQKFVIGRKDEKSIKGVTYLIIKNKQSNGEKQDMQYQTQQKKLNKNNKRVNPGEILEEYLNQHLIENQVKMRKKKKTPTNKQQFQSFKRNSPFSQIKIQKEALRKVYIKNGEYKKSLSEQNLPKKVGNRFQQNFQKIISDTIARKTSFIPKLQASQLKRIMMQTYNNIVKTYTPAVSQQSNKINHIRTFKTSTIQDLRNSIMNMKNKSPQKGYTSVSSSIVKPVLITSQKALKSNFDYILAPTQSIVETKQQIGQQKKMNIQSKKSTRSNNKLILLNHMMKPIVYQT